MKPVELPPEAEEQLGAFRALAAEAERMVASAQAQLREIAKQGEAETERAREVVHAMIDDKLVAAELVAEAWADYELATARARAQVLRAKATPAKGAADEIRAKGKELAALRREAKCTQWVLKLYEWHFPWLADLRDDDEARAYLGQPAEPTEADPRGRPRLALADPRGVRQALRGRAQPASARPLPPKPQVALGARAGLRALHRLPARAGRLGQ